MAGKKMPGANTSGFKKPVMKPGSRGGVMKGAPKVKPAQDDDEIGMSEQPIKGKKASPFPKAAVKRKK